MRIIDADGHVNEDSEAIGRHLPREIFDDERISRISDRWFPPLDHFHAFNGRTPKGSFKRVDPDGWLRFLDDVGIETTVLYPTLGLSFGNVFHRDWAIALASAYNDWLVEAYISKAPRFKGIGLIPMQDPEAAVVELRRIVEKLGFCGAMLPANGLKDHLGAKEYWPVYAEASRLNCALSVHGGAYGGMGFDHMNVYTPVGAMGHPLSLLINFSGIVFNGILDRYPNVRFGFMEGGVAWLLTAVERFERSHATHVQFNPRGELSPAPGDSATEYLRQHIQQGRLFIGCEGDEPSLPHAVDMLGSDPFVFSSDFPHEVNSEMCKGEIAELKETSGLTDLDKEKILARNAVRFYNLG